MWVESYVLTINIFSLLLQAPLYARFLGVLRSVPEKEAVWLRREAKVDGCELWHRNSLWLHDPAEAERLGAEVPRNLPPRPATGQPLRTGPRAGPGAFLLTIDYYYYHNYYTYYYYYYYHCYYYYCYYYYYYYYYHYYNYHILLGLQRPVARRAGPGLGAGRWLPRRRGRRLAAARRLRLRPPQGGCRGRAVIFIPISLPPRVLQTSYCTHFFCTSHLLCKIVLGMGMGMRVTAQRPRSRGARCRRCCPTPAPRARRRAAAAAAAARTGTRSEQ